VEFDDVIAGDGSAGAALAARLSEDTLATVCLLEVGGLRTTQAMRALRPLVHAAVQVLMTADGCGEDKAYGRLRRKPMTQRLTVEQTAPSIRASPRRQTG
jgi:choline dehydrogenase-like flavoprotein